MPFPIAPYELNFGQNSLSPTLAPLDLSSDFGLAPTAPAGAPGSSLMDYGNLALSGLQTLGNLWGAFQMRNLAKKQFNFTKDITETNLANQIKSYNTALADRARSRGVMEGQSAAQTQAYVDQNSLSRHPNGI